MDLLKAQAGVGGADKVRRIAQFKDPDILLHAVLAGLVSQAFNGFLRTPQLLNIGKFLQRQFQVVHRFGDQPFLPEYAGVVRNIQTEGVSDLFHGLQLKTGFQVAMEFHFRDVFAVHD